MVDVRTEVLIGRPRAIVAAFAGNPDNAPRWYVNIQRVTWKSAPPLQVGSEMQFEARFLGRTLRYTYRVEELVPDARLVMRTSDGPFPMETTYEWEAASATSTVMRLRNCGSPTGFSLVLGPVLSMAMRRENAKDLRRLKRLLETGV